MVEQVKVPNRRVREGTRQPRPRTKTMTWTWSPNRTRRPRSASAQGNDLPVDSGVDRGAHPNT